MRQGDKGMWARKYATKNQDSDSPNFMWVPVVVFDFQRDPYLCRGTLSWLRWESKRRKIKIHAVRGVSLLAG